MLNKPLTGGRGKLRRINQLIQSAESSGDSPIVKQSTTILGPGKGRNVRNNGHVVVMDYSSIPLFGVIRKRLSWLAQRQEVLAQNIANSDTPRYRPSDLKAFDFKELIRRESMQINMATTREGHLGGRRKRIRDFTEEVTRRPYETSPDGNAVVLEEQMVKIAQTQISHTLATKLYSKHLEMFLIAIGKN